MNQTNTVIKMLNKSKKDLEEYQEDLIQNELTLDLIKLQAKSRMYLYIAFLVYIPFVITLESWSMFHIIIIGLAILVLFITSVIYDIAFTIKTLKR